MDAEKRVHGELLAHGRGLPLDLRHAAAQASEWILSMRASRNLSYCDAMLDAFGLSTCEGRALMRIAEALLRTPDQESAWQLVRENLADAQWRPPSTATRTARVAAALMRWTSYALGRHGRLPSPLKSLIVYAARYGVALIADHFIAASTVEAAMTRMKRDPALQLCSIDCLGESARTAAQAQRYLRAYEDAIQQLALQPAAPIHMRHSISVKLSALEPRFGPRHRGTYGVRLIPSVLHLARRAASANVGLTIDAEEQDRLESTLEVVAALIEDPRTRGWEGLGVAVQAYGQRALQVIDWISCRARQHRRRLNVRLVKGAYWDSEIKRAQERGLDSFPVFIDKEATDVSYLVVAQRLFERRELIFPQFATHNALSIAAIRTLAPPGAAFEFQRLHGMGEQLYRAAAKSGDFPPLRVYAPVGSHEELLAYLIRRLLENGANSSFMRHVVDPTVAVEDLLDDPIEALADRLHARRFGDPLEVDELGDRKTMLIEDSSPIVSRLGS